MESKDQGEPWVQLLKGLPADQAGKFVNSFLSMVDVAIRNAIPPALDNALLNLGYTEEIAGLTQLLAAKSNDSKEDVLRKALTLYSLALEAKERGNRLSILNSDDVIVHEVSGFEPVDSEVQPIAG
jgi:hypothetical protein